MNRAFLVGAGELSNHEMRAGSRALAMGWGGNLIEYTCAQNPINTLHSLPHEDCLVQLLGDAAIDHPHGGSWLEALGAWRQPVILKVISTSSGNVPGSAAAYTALCHSLKVPLIGLIQLGGNWNQTQRRLDGLPWLGFLSDNQVVLTNSDSETKYADENLDELLFVLNQRLCALGDL